MFRSWVASRSRGVIAEISIVAQPFGPTTTYLSAMYAYPS